MANTVRFTHERPEEIETGSSHCSSRSQSHVQFHHDSKNDDYINNTVNNFATNIGLAPGMHSHNSQEKTSDEESQTHSVGGNDIPMIDFNEKAREILGKHTVMDADTLTDHSDASSTIIDSGDDSGFFAAPMDGIEDGDMDNTDSENDFEAVLDEDGEEIAAPKRVRGGVLGSLMKLYQNEEVAPSSASLMSTASESDVMAKRKKNMATNMAHKSMDKTKGQIKRLKRKKKSAERRITRHIADLLQRQRFVLRMCKALMLYGAPTHRLEDYMVMTCRVLEIDGQFLYIPGCMIVSFGDSTTRTSEVQLVRCAQGLNLWKLHQVHSIYKTVIHDKKSAEEGNLEIDTIIADKNLYPPWLCVLLFGFCSAMVTPYAFGGHWVNLAISFFMGSCVGFLQFVVSNRSHLYSNVFEITASIVVSFCGRAFGSIPHSKICFGAVTQGSLALILPGYIILCGSLELQSRNMVAGAVRMFYAIIYSLFLGFGITLGTALFGWLYGGATNEASCPQLISPWFRFLFVPAFTIGISLLNQAKWTQLPTMVIISSAGYVVTYFAGKHFQNSTEFTAALAAFVIGVMGNLYSRIWQGLAVSAMLPAIFVQVPSGVASQSSLLSGLNSANQIVRGNSTSAAGSTDITSGMSFGVTMIEVSIGISVGLFASTLFVYPFGKKTSSLFSL
ncbi:threonine/serine exporter family protein KNAG_0B01650 [Huiozyma naganishii CBS 8797]|uniref:Pheromone-regulated membrane protein 10 n=1 Tax=Huiozyma naganishii (strain ATCC MYA-139 / BCRC 22969 / CBS 8797 / KCTC 17520 / NBRC 10181 / NCYC 3082 / Yp74L-3) TaxID=1071383 RepID=J7S4J5_HUIN7|nr:hypothetical protein KNAG_0B01650 [Kazachstania naganishii CBS 8797]CCK68611.1 hypothetical protein KNAG_0B01650 [Kazachstania naganishii CBS 8797]